MDLRGYLTALRKGWWIIALCAVAGGGISGFLSFRTPPTYQSSVTFFVSTAAPEGTNVYVSEQFAQARINSYVQILKSDLLARTVQEEIAPEWKLTTTEISRAITGSVDLNTVLMTADVVDTVPDRSLAVARAVAARLDAVIASLDPADVNRAPVQLTVTSGPTLLPHQIAPDKKFDIAVGTMLGLVAGVVLALLRELFDNTYRTVAVLREGTGMPGLGDVPFDSGLKKSPLVVGQAAHSVRAEAYRQIRANLQFSDVDARVQVIQVTSALVAEAKSTTAANLAVVFAETGQRVLLVEADLRRPRISDLMGVERAVGLSNVLAGHARIEHVLQPWGGRGLVVLPSGSLPPNPSVLLGSKNMADLMVQFRSQFDVIILDTPPVLPVADAAIVTSLADGVLFVVRAGKTTRAQVASALHALEAVDAQVLGTVLTMGRRGTQDRYGRYGPTE